MSIAEIIPDSALAELNPTCAEMSDLLDKGTFTLAELHAFCLHRELRNGRKAKSSKNAKAWRAAHPLVSPAAAPAPVPAPKAARQRTPEQQLRKDAQAWRKAQYLAGNPVTYEAALAHFGVAPARPQTAKRWAARAQARAAKAAA
jgi:hypothetical protein